MHDLGRIEESVICNQKSVELCPNFAMGYNNLGFDLFKLNKIKEAINSYEKAIELDSNISLYHTNRQNALEQLEADRL